MKKIIIKAAKEAGKLLLENFQTKKASKIFEQKSKFDYSTQMDKMAEDLIISMLKENGIKGTVISEEIGDINLGSSGYKFFIDPLDGTINYSSDISLFCTSIGVKKNDETEYGVVYYPDKKELFFAERGKGAFLNNRKLIIDSKQNFDNCTFDFSLDPTKTEMVTKTLEKLIKVVRLRSIFSAALATSFIACNRIQGAVYVHQKSWDLMAASLIVKEAGGITTDFEGKKWDENSKNFIAASPNLHEKILKLVNC